MKYEVVTYGQKVLKKKARRIERVDSSIRKLARDMLETMYAANGVGLAAEQVGADQSICVIDVPTELENPEGPAPAINRIVPMPLVMINPEITAMVGSQTGDEGCLSFPEITVRVRRAAEVIVRYTNLQDQTESIRAAGLLARAVQHEVDHLNGVLLVDHMSAVQKLANAAKLRKLKRLAAGK